jgi:hypothetical protein
LKFKIETFFSLFSYILYLVAVGGGGSGSGGVG